MKLLALLQRHAMVVWLATAVLVVLGVASAFDMPSAIYPEVEFPRIVVVARAGGAPPDVFITRVTRPLEQALATVLGVQRIRSTTLRGGTEVALQFAPDTDMWRALSMVEAKTSEVSAALPAGTEIEVERITTGSFPVISFNVSGPVDPRILRETAELVVRPVIANVPGVGRVEVLGGATREIEVIADPEALTSLHLTAGALADRLRSAMGQDAVGRVERDRQTVTVISDAQPRTLDDIRAIPIQTTSTGNVVPLGSVAEVTEGASDRTTRVAGPKGETVAIAVARLPNASTPDVVRRIRAAIDSITPMLPPGVTIDRVYDQASLVQESMATVRDAILLGIALCAGVVGLFLRDVRAGLMAAISVPVTLAVSFGAMRLGHQSLNLMSLGGMAVAIGLAIDDAIVVIEAIARSRDAGADARTAAVDGAAALAPAVIGTTLTTVVVFVPLGLLQGTAGDFFRALAFTVTAAVLVSLAVALALVPLAASHGMSSHPHARAGRLAAVYDRFVRRAAARPLLSAGVFAAVLVSGTLLGSVLGRGFLPEMDEGAFVLDYFLPAGTSLDVTDSYARRIERELRSTPEVVTYARRTGAELGPATVTATHRGDIVVRLRSLASRHRSAQSVMSDLRARIERNVPEARVEFVQVLQDVLADLSGNPRPIEVKLFGPDYSELERAGDRLARELESVPGLVDVYSGHERVTPETAFVARRDAIARLGATPSELEEELGTALRGALVGAVRRGDRLLDVRLRYPDRVRFDAAAIRDLPLSIGGHTTTFHTVSDIVETTTPSVRLHEALGPLVDVTADYENRDLGAVADDVERVVARTKLPPGCRAVVGGQIESQRSALRQLAVVAAVALLLVLTVLAAQFRRLRIAALVLASVPLAMVGAVLALAVTATPLNASSSMGMVLLIGLVVKNGILLLEEAEKRADEGVDPIEAVAIAGERRLRPVLMTTLATLAGLLPLALGLGAGAELQRPLAIAVIGGLLTSTAATLGLLPPLAAAVLRRDRKHGVSRGAPA